MLGPSKRKGKVVKLRRAFVHSTLVNLNGILSIVLSHGLKLPLCFASDSGGSQFFQVRCCCLRPAPVSVGIHVAKLHAPSSILPDGACVAQSPT